MPRACCRCESRRQSVSVSSWGHDWKCSCGVNGEASIMENRCFSKLCLLFIWCLKPMIWLLVPQFPCLYNSPLQWTIIELLHIPGFPEYWGCRGEGLLWISGDTHPLLGQMRLLLRPFPSGTICSICCLLGFINPPASFPWELIYILPLPPTRSLASMTLSLYPSVLYPAQVPSHSCHCPIPGASVLLPSHHLTYFFPASLYCWIHGNTECGLIWAKYLL